MLNDSEEQRLQTMMALGRLADASEWPDEDVRFRARLIDDHFGKCTKLKRLIKSGKDAAARRAQITLLKSYAGRMCAVAREIVPPEKHLAPKPMSVVRFDALARAIRPDRRIPGVSRLYLKQKLDGGDRPITSPGTTHRAAQRLVEDAIAPWGLSNPFDFNRPKAGRDAAIREIARLIEKRVLATSSSSMFKTFSRP